MPTRIAFYINRDEEVIREDVNSSEYDLKVVLKHQNQYWV